MRIRSALAVAPLLVAIACTDGAPPTANGGDAAASARRAGTAPTCETTAVVGSITSLYPPRDRGATLRRFHGARVTALRGDVESAWPEFLGLAADALERATAGTLLDPRGPTMAADGAVRLVDQLYACGGRAPVGDVLGDVLAGGVDVAFTVVLPGEPTTLVVPSANFGVKDTEGGFFDEAALLVIERVPDSPPFVPETFTEYPPRYKVYVLPETAQANFGRTVGAGDPTIQVIICPADPHPSLDDLTILRVPDDFPTTAAHPLDTEHVHDPDVTCSEVDPYPGTTGAAQGFGARVFGALRHAGAAAFGWLAPEPLYAVDGGIGGRTSLLSQFVAVARESAPTPGMDVVVFNDANMFDDLALANAGNQQLVRNLVSFATPGVRGAGTLVVLEAGHRSAYAPCFDTAAENEIVEAGYTFVRQASAVVGTQPASAKVLILCLPTTPYSTSEINAMKQFAEEGGRIVFVGEHSGYYGAGIAVENQFLLDMGAVMTNVGEAIDCVSDTQQRPIILPAASLRSHQVTTDVGELDVACASVIVPGEGDFALFYDRSNTKVLGGVATIDVTPLPPPTVASARRAGPTAAPSVAATARTHDLDGRPLPR